MWFFAIVAVLLLVAGLLGPSLGVDIGMMLTPAVERTPAHHDLIAIQWLSIRELLFVTSFAAFVAAIIAAWKAMNRPLD
jgi:hypothetical protein